MKLTALGLTFGLAALGVGTCSSFSVVEHSNRDTYQVKVTGYERLPGESKGDSGKYVVFTKDAQTGEARAFENTDTVLECAFSDCKFDSSTLQARITDQLVPQFTSIK